MVCYFLKRVLLALPALWLVLTLVFLMIHIVPGDPSSKCWAREQPQGSSLNCVMHWDWIYPRAQFRMIGDTG